LGLAHERVREREMVAFVRHLHHEPIADQLLELVEAVFLGPAQDRRDEPQRKLRADHGSAGEQLARLIAEMLEPPDDGLLDGLGNTNLAQVGLLLDADERKHLLDE
jgi:hypothetical protein